jgi:hypothetical protein
MDRFGCPIAYPSRWEVSEEPADDDFDSYDVYCGPMGDEISVYMAPLERAGVEPLNAWIRDFCDYSIENWQGTREDSIVDVDVFGRPSPVQEFQHVDVDGDGSLIHGIYSVAQLTPDTVHEFIWYSSPGNHEEDFERFTSFL